MRHRSSTSARGLLLALGALVAAAEAAPQGDLDGLDALGELEGLEDLADLSLEDLMNVDVEVTTVSRSSESSNDAAAAVFVVTAEDMRRIGARSIPEALRIVPGLRVTRTSSGRYAVSARGFHWNYSDKLLVMIDGMSVYSPSFAGTEWQMHDLPVEEVERIEVIRGPGGTMWGANAVNGVINIITRKAEGDPRESVVAVVGSEERGDLQIRGGTALVGGGALRAYLRANGRDSLDSNGTGFEDRYEQVRFGLRADVPIDERTDFFVRADASTVNDDVGGALPLAEPPYLYSVPVDRDSEGINVLARWTREHESGSITSLQASYGFVDSESAITNAARHQLDVWGTYEYEPIEGHRVLGGGSFRWWAAETEDGAVVDWDEEFTSYLGGAFLQDRIDLTEDLKLTVGAKVEYSEYAGVELQPQLRAAYRASDDTTVWASVARAVQTPRDSTSHASLDFLASGAFVPGFTTLIRSVPSDDPDTESVLTYELGGRSRVTDRLRIDAALFYSDYERIAIPVLGTPTLVDANTIVQPFTFDPAATAHSYGAELAVEYAAAPNVAVEASYSYVRLHENQPEGTYPNNYASGEPWHRAHLRCLWDIDDERQFDLAMYYSAESPEVGAVPAMFRLDGRYGWRPNDDLEVSFAVQGLFHDGEKEDDFNLFVPLGGPEAGAYLLVQYFF